MRLYSVNSYEYDADIAKLLLKRLKRRGMERNPIKKLGKNKLKIEIDNDSELLILSGALCELLIMDLKYFEIALMVNNLPFELKDKQKILPKAVEKAKPLKADEAVVKNMFEYLRENELLILEGYLRFRLQDVMESWAVCVDTAAEELLVRKEYDELIKLLSMYTELTAPSVEKLTVVLHPDGSSTLTDNDRIRIDCAADSIDGMISMLIGMSPRKIVIFDLSCGQCEKLRETVTTLFGERVFYYKEI